MQRRILETFRAARDLILAAALVTGNGSVLLWCGLYLAERSAQPGVFSSVPATIAFSMEFVAALGQNVPSPATVLGKVLLSTLVLLWAVFVATVLGVLHAGLRRSPPECPHCGRAVDRVETAEGL